MIAVAIACLPIFFTGHLIARWEGGLFFLYFVAYTGYLIAAATSPAITRALAVVVLGFVIPLTAVTLAVGVVRTLCNPRRVDA
jgi:cation:H+ antiporter